MTSENRSKADERCRLVAAYGLFLETLGAEPLEISDVRHLPFDKNALLEALCLELVRAATDHEREAIKIGALTLAQFQEGVGDQPLNPLGMRLPRVIPETDEGLEALFDSIGDNPDSERYDAFKALCDEETTSIWARLLAAEELGRAMPEKKKREVLG